MSRLYNKRVKQQNARLQTRISIMETILWLSKIKTTDSHSYHDKGNSQTIQFNKRCTILHTQNVHSKYCSTS